MWEQGGSSRIHEGPSDAFVTYQTFASEIHVLLVDHDKECLISTARLLELCSYRVTVVELASTALLMLQKGKERFDLVMANVHSPDMHGFQLLEEAVNMDLPVILMTTDEDAGLARTALERGAFLFIQKPATVEILMYLWQHVLREQRRRLREREILGDMPRDTNRRRSNGYHGTRHGDQEENGVENSTPQRRCYRTRRRGRGQKGTNDNEEDSEPVQINRVKRKVCTEWTKELHARFMDAVRQLGEGRCYPKEILELMNVPGLTRMQVASHLQKCRNDNWRAPEERKNNSPSNQAPSNVDLSQSRNNARRFGSMPLNAGNYQPRSLENQDRFRAPEIYTLSGKNNFVRGECSDQQVYRPQLHLETTQYYNGNAGTHSTDPIQSMRQLRPIGTSSAVLSIGNARDGAAGSSTNAMVVQNEMSNGVGNLASGSGNTITHHHYESMISELTIATPGTDSHVSSAKRQPSDDFFDFQDMDYLITSFNDVRQGPSTSQSPNPHGINLEKPYSAQNSMASNM